MFESFEIVDFEELLVKNYVELVNLKWITCVRNRKKKSNGEYIVGEIKALNPFMNYLSIDENAENGYDLVLILDGLLFKSISSEDQEALLKLLLKTVSYDGEKIKINKFSLLSYNDITPEEVLLYERLQAICESLYENTED